VGWYPGGDRLDQEIFDAMTEFVTQLMQHGERLAERFDVPMSCMKAIRRLDAAVTMKDLGQRLHCDPSFVTMIADALEQRGLAKREPNPADRRIKNLVLTEHGHEVKAALEHETLGEMPWTRALSVEEREQFLGLVRKMNVALAAVQPAASAEEVNTDTGVPVSS
jgi:DNA-binding MarR family transcriptional regulator